MTTPSFADLRSQDVYAAADRIRGVVRRTPLRHSAALSELTGTDVYLKLECEQTTGSFKLRGAYNALASLPAEARARGVVAASAGNHGLGIAYSARELAIPATLYIPSTAPHVKRDGIAALGATIDASSPDYEAALVLAMQHAERESIPFVSATQNLDVVAGQGTAALEILEELRSLRTVLVPVGGAGLLAGFGMFLRDVAPDVRIIGVQGTRSAAMARSLEANRVVPVPHEITLADGLAGDIDEFALDVGRNSLDLLAIVTEEEIEAAIAWLYTQEGLVVEGSGAVGVAALLQKKVYKPGGPVVVVLGGAPKSGYIPRMSLSVRFLGTSAARPTVERNVSSIAVIREGETLLFDCGEGTQRQMMRYGITFALDDVFISHFHGDHIIGVIGLFRTLALQGRTEPMRMFGPRGAARVLRGAAQFGVDRVGFPVEITEVAPGQRIAREGYSIIPFATEHSGELSLGYTLAEEDRKGRFDPGLARSLGIPEGPLWGKIHKGESVALEDGRVIEPSVLVGPRRAGRTVVITGDTRPSEATIEAARGADLLVHEATFADEEAVRASETGHSTAREAARVAAAAGVRRLALTHFSARYSRDPGELLREAREEFKEVVLARDGMELEIPFRDEPAEVPGAPVPRAAEDPASSPRR